jgi:hypothetical protein
MSNNEVTWLDTAGAAMWRLVERYTGKIGYKLGAKAENLDLDPPVIDCSGWTALLLSHAMKAANEEATVFSEADLAAIQTYSERIIENLERRAGFVILGDLIQADTLPRYATIGLQQGGGAWAANKSRPRGITHIVQVVRRPDDGVAYVSEAAGFFRPPGLRLVPLADWLEQTRSYLRPGAAWAVDPFTT